MFEIPPRYQLTTEREAVIREIEEAFAGVTLDGGVTLHEADVIDAYGTDQQRAAARLLDKDQRWQDVPAADIEHYYDIFPFFDEKGFRYYLPAYMVWALKNYDRSESATVDWVIYNLNPYVQEEKARQRFGTFNEQQSRAISTFLNFMAYEASGNCDAKEALAGLERYWGRFSK